MICRYNLKLICLLLLINLFSNQSGFAQNTSVEFWPETDIWYRLSPEWRFSAYIPITKYNESKNRDLNIYLQLDYAWGKTLKPFYKGWIDENEDRNIKGWLGRIGFMEGWSLGENAGLYSEDMLYGEIHKRIPVKGAVLISHRLRTDTRWLGDDDEFSYRFRYRLMIEKEYEVGRFTIVPFANVEPFWDSRYNTISRVRAIGGTTFSSGKRFAYEGNITYQYDTNYQTNNLFALNLILHIYIETQKGKN